MDNDEEKTNPESNDTLGLVFAQLAEIGSSVRDIRESQLRFAERIETIERGPRVAATICVVCTVISVATALIQFFM